MAAFYKGLDALYGDDYGTKARKRVYKDSISYGRKRAKKKGIAKPGRKLMEKLSSPKRSIGTAAV
jgi:hypothetical protein